MIWWFYIDFQSKPCFLCNTLDASTNSPEVVIKELSLNVPDYAVNVSHHPMISEHLLSRLSTENLFFVKD